MSAQPITAEEYLAQQSNAGLFEVYERKVADWLEGECAPAHTPAFDVVRCAGFPHLTFQVKYSNVYKYGGSAARHMTRMWTFHQAKWHDVFPHYFVLFGISEDGVESCFCMSRHTFKKHSSASKTRGGRIMQIPPNRVVMRGNARSSYPYQPWAWDYHLPSPQTQLRATVLKLESWKQDGLL